MTAFKAGDHVAQPQPEGPPPPGFTAARYLRQEVQIAITLVEPGRITARVTVLGDFFSALRLDGAHNTSQGFVLGETITLKPAGTEDSWRIDTPHNRPWHILSCRNGRKTFEHYR